MQILKDTPQETPLVLDPKTTDRNNVLERIQLKLPPMVIPDELEKFNLGVRIMLKMIENGLKQSCEEYLFDPNDDETRMHICDSVDRYLESIPSIHDYFVTCNATNNPPVIVDQNMCVIDVGLQLKEIPDWIHVPITIGWEAAEF